MELKTSYILVAVRNKKDLKPLLENLKEYIVKNDNNTSIGIKHHLDNFTTYITIKDGYTKILNEYWLQDKIYVACVSSKSNIISDDDYTLKQLNSKGYIEYGFIIDTNYQERALKRNNKIINMQQFKERK